MIPAGLDIGQMRISWEELYVLSFLEIEREIGTSDCEGRIKAKA
tara:strand:- start:39 stop:170 length:132 start_codon:yes stop_codon:yes gene_type:complete